MGAKGSWLILGVHVQIWHVEASEVWEELSCPTDSRRLDFPSTSFKAVKSVQVTAVLDCRHPPRHNRFLSALLSVAGKAGSMVVSLDEVGHPDDPSYCKSSKETMPWGFEAYLWSNYIHLYLYTSIYIYTCIHIFYQKWFLLLLLLLFFFFSCSFCCRYCIIHGSRCQPRPFKELLARAAVTWRRTALGRQKLWKITMFSGYINYKWQYLIAFWMFTRG